MVIFQPTSACPGGFSCDALEPQDKSATTGICNKSRGYRIDSFHQALWESMHAQTCALDPPFTCEARPALVTEPAGDMVGGALMFALRVDTATYRGFADDMATHVSCTHGEAAYKAFNEILCHHGIRDCDAPTPVVCKTCGNGVVERDEGCDGADFAGKGCADRGFSGGALMCDANCVIDDSMCVSDGSTTGTGGGLPMTGFDIDVPTTGSPGAGSVGGEDAGGAGSEGSAGGEGGQEGCGCGTGRGPSAWLTLVLGGGAWLRRRRVRGGGALLLGAVVVLASGCHTDRAMSEGSSGSEETGGSEGMSASASTTGGEGEVDRRMFGRFHDDSVEVGYINADHDDPVAGRVYYFWTELEIHADGTLVTDHRVCDSGPGITQFTWEHAGGGRVVVVPDARNSDGSFEYFADFVSSVMFAPGDGCDDVVEVIQYPPDDGRPPLTLRLVPGKVCAEPLSEEMCDFQFTWCDGVAPPVCMEAGDGG